MAAQKSIKNPGLLARLREGRFNDSDAGQFFVEARETVTDPFVREFGDFFAHRSRDKGPVLEQAAIALADIELLNHHSQLGPYSPSNGACPWWLRTVLMSIVGRIPQRQVQREFGKSVREVVAELNAAFPTYNVGKHKYPERVEASISTWTTILRVLEKHDRIEIATAFTVAKARSALEEILQAHALDRGLADPLLVASLISIANTTSKFGSYTDVHFELGVDKPRMIELGPDTRWPGARRVIYLPDGNLQLLCYAKGTGALGKPMTHGFPAMITDIDTERYFSREFIVADVGVTRLDLSRKMEFRMDYSPPVTPL